MKISIAMTTFNGGEYLEQQLISFAKQQKLPDELIICDDRSSDDTIKILEQFSKRVPFDVKIYINDHNLGFIKNFEKALSKCNGDIIFLSDQDDSWFPNKISSILKHFNSNSKSSLIIHDAEIVDENLKYHGSNTLSQVLRGYGSTDVYITGALTAIRKDLLDYALPFPENIESHDGWIHNVAKILNKREILRTSLGLIRRHSNNTSGWIASSIKKVNFFDVMMAQIDSVKISPYQTYDDRILINISLMEVIKKYRTNFKNKDTNFLDKKEEYLKKEYKALMRRNNLQSYSFFLRKLRVFQLLLRGDYVYFNNLKSFIRDMIR